MIMTKAETKTEQNQSEQVRAEQVRTEEFEVRGDQVVAKVKGLIHEGNIRRISLQTEGGETLLEVPLTIGLAGAVAGVVLAPMLTAIGLLAAIVTKLKVKVERVEKQADAVGQTE
jgi:ribosomal protein L10